MKEETPCASKLEYPGETAEGQNFIQNIDVRVPNARDVFAKMGMRERSLSGRLSLADEMLAQAVETDPVLSELDGVLDADPLYQQVRSDFGKRHRYTLVHALNHECLRVQLAAAGAGGAIDTHGHCLPTMDTRLTSSFSTTDGLSHHSQILTPYGVFVDSASKIVYTLKRCGIDFEKTID